MDLTKGSIPQHIKTIAIPAAIGMLFSTLYNITDTFFAGLYGAEALAALGATFPIFFLVIAVGAGLSQGTNALISNYLGENKTKKANMVARQGISYAVLTSLVLSLIGVYTAPLLFSFLGLSATTIPLAVSYMNILYLGLSVFLLAYVSNAALLARGDTKSIRNVFMIGFFLNFLLNPLFMFFFNLGVAGIALATVVIYLFNVTYYMYQGKKQGVYDDFTFQDLLPQKSYGKEILAQAFPAGMNMGTVAIGIFIITYFFGQFGESAIAAYGIATRIEQLVLLPTIGLNMAVLSLVGQNFGAKKYKRLLIILKTALFYGTILMTIGGILLFFFGKYAILAFTDDSVVIAIGSQYLSVAAFILYAYVLFFISKSFFQGMKKPWIPFVFSILRQILIPLIVFSVVLSLFDSITYLFLSILIINWILSLILFFSLKIYLKKMVA